MKVIICLVRGLRWATGALEDGFALIQADIERRLEATLALFSGTCLLIEGRCHRITKKPNRNRPEDKVWLTAAEAFVEVACTVSADYDRWELQAEARRVLGFSHRAAHMEVCLAGHNFLYVLGTDSPAFDNNLPPSCVTNWPGAVFTITKRLTAIIVPTVPS